MLKLKLIKIDFRKYCEYTNKDTSKTITNKNNLFDGCGLLNIEINKNK